MFRLFKKKTPAEEFLQTYGEFVEEVTGAFERAEDCEQVAKPMKMLQDFADMGIVHAQGLLALALLREDKPWYDPDRGLPMLKDAAEKDEPFSQHMLGSILYKGMGSVPADRIMAKYWIKKSADNDYPPAIEDYEMIWGSC